MRIVVAHNSYQQRGGEDGCVAAEVAMLRSHGHEVIQYTISNDEIDSMPRLTLAARTIWSGTSYSAMRTLFRNARPDVVHFHNTFPLISPAAYYAARREGVAVVQTLHNHRLLCCNAILFREGQVCRDCVGTTVPWRGVVRGCYRGSRVASLGVASMIGMHKAAGTWRHAVDLYIALSQSSRTNFIEAGFAEDKIAVKPHFVFPDPGMGPGGGRYCLYVGRLSEEKGLLTLVRAWQQLGAPMRLAIVGDGPMLPAVQAAATENASIQLLGACSQDAVYDLIGQAEILIAPSECHETFGRVVAEAFAKGTPVLAARIGALAELVEDGRNGRLFEPGNAHDLAQKVQSLIGDGDQLRHMREAARRTFERDFTADSNHATLVRLYRKAAASMRTASPQRRLGPIA